MDGARPSGAGPGEAAVPSRQEGTGDARTRRQEQVAIPPVNPEPKFKRHSSTQHSSTQQGAC